MQWSREMNTFMKHEIPCVPLSSARTISSLLICVLIGSEFAVFLSSVRGADAAEPTTLPIVVPVNPGVIDTIASIPFEVLIRRAMGDVDSTGNVIQPRPRPNAEIAPELLEAYKDLMGTSKRSGTYATVRLRYLDQLDVHGDPSGSLPTKNEIDELQQTEWKQSFQRPLAPLAMLDRTTLLVEAQELVKTADSTKDASESEKGHRLWAVAHDGAKPAIAVGDRLSLKITETAKAPTGPPSGKLLAFRYIKPAGVADQLLAVKYSGGSSLQERSESYAVWNREKGVRVVLAANERIPKVAEAWSIKDVDEIHVDKSGVMAFLVTGVRESDAKTNERFVLLVTGRGEVRIAAVLAASADDGAGSPHTDVKVGDQRFQLGCHIYQVEFAPEDRMRDGVVTLRAGPFGESWNISVTDGSPLAAIRAADPPAKFKPFPLPALEGFGRDQSLEPGPSPRSHAIEPVEGPDGRVAFLAYVTGKRPTRLDATRGVNLRAGHPSKNWVLLESKARGDLPQLVAESATPVPAPIHRGKHYLGSITWMKYLPDGRLLFSGADDSRDVQAGRDRAEASVTASVWLWDGGQLYRIADSLCPVEVPSGQPRMIGLMDCEYDQWHDQILLTRKSGGQDAPDCAFVASLQAPH
jgi:hypothetical protein